MTVEWFTPVSKPTLEWFGQKEGTLATIQEQGISVVASVAGIKGDQGEPGTSTIVIDPQPDNRLTNPPEGLYVPPISEGELTNMVLLFENSLL